MDPELFTLPFTDYTISKTAIAFWQMAFTGMGVLGGGIALGIWRHLRQRSKERSGDATNRFIVSRNDLTEQGNNAFLLQLRNIGAEESLDAIIHDVVVRDAMVKAAYRCSAEMPYLLLADEDLQSRMHQLVLNHLTRYTYLGEMYDSLKLPTKSKKVLFTVVCIDGGAKAEQRKFRCLWVGEDTLKRCMGEHEWQYEVPYHKVRSRTLEKLADIYFNKAGCYTLNGECRNIFGWLEVKVPDFTYYPAQILDEVRGTGKLNEQLTKLIGNAHIAENIPPKNGIFGSLKSKLDTVKV